MKYDFDQVIPREGTGSVKWEFVMQGEELRHWDDVDEHFEKQHVLPMWVADMDFRGPDEVIEAVIERARQGMFGYTAPTQHYYRVVRDWMAKRQNWKVEQDWIVVTPGVVPALNLLIRTFLKPGEKVLVQPPVYYPFYHAIENNECQILPNPLIYENGKYRMDFADLAEKVRDPDLKMAILCSPHNPVGRVWAKEELKRFGEICLEHNVLVVSDEIHADLIYKGVEFTPYATISDELTDNSIICTAPSKTFNLAGLKTSNIMIPNPQLREAFIQTIGKSGLFGVNPFGVVATQAAYRYGEDWLDQVMEYIEGNYQFLRDYLREYIPQIKVIEPQGTYLVWLDCRGLGLDKEALKHLIFNDAGVYLDDGFLFGSQGDGFQRINLACPRSILAEALERIRDTLA
jgi:cystathionine beta-lyase